MDAISEVVGADSPERRLTIERIFDAPRELVFKCWSEPEHLGRWIGPKGFTSTILTFEFHEGGNYRIHMRGPDDQDHWQHGVFREVVPPERIVRTFCWTDAQGKATRPETMLTVRFDDLGGKTRLTLHQAVFESTSARDQHQGGWNSSLDRLCEHIETRIEQMPSKEKLTWQMK